MGTLNAALQWARRGFSVFPLRENTREPAHEYDWNDIATTDADAIRAMWVDPVLKVERDYNVGCACTDMVVVDIDVKNGKDGYNEYMQLGGGFDTLVVRTPSGGFHCYFHGPNSSNAPLTPAVDVRSNRGYVVAPGSMIDGTPYVVASDKDMAWVPFSIEKILQPPHVRTEFDEKALVLDSPAAVEAGRKFAESAPPAIEGQRGDEVTYITAAHLVRELALSVHTAFALLRDYWNPRCNPPWGVDELMVKVENAYSYGSADVGRLTPELLFGQVKFEAPTPVFSRVADWGNALLPGDIAPRPWLVERMLMLRSVTLLLAAGSAGKSSISLALAAHLALGLDFAGYKTRRPCKTVVYNGEDDLEEQSRRLLGICTHYKLDYDTVRSKVMLLSARQFKMQLVRREGHKPVRNDELVRQVTELTKDEEVGLFIVDPLVKLHQCDESDNVGMDAVMETLTDIAYDADISVLALHHTGKANDKQEDRVGNMDISRGASAIIYAARIAFTLLNACRQDEADYGIKENERNQYVRLDDAKMNLSLASTEPTWFRKHGVHLPNLDVVGVLDWEKKQKSDIHIRIDVANVLVSFMMASNQGSVPIAQAAGLCRKDVGPWANKRDTDIRRELEALLATPFLHQGKTIQAVRTTTDTSSRVMITLT